MNPRFNIPGRQIQITDTIERDIIDMSISGVSFYSDRNHAIGEVVPLCLDGAFSVQTKVVGCQMVQTDPSFLEFKYRVRCEFVNSDHGLIFLMLALEDSGYEGNGSIQEQTGT
ncbi:MAG: PilZ domain-containing protein [SAR324 cluster bacterium]|nr:PilZ domain-containing protein [SAR324 cluster bacterium]